MGTFVMLSQKKIGSLTLVVLLLFCFLCEASRKENRNVSNYNYEKVQGFLHEIVVKELLIEAGKIIAFGTNERSESKEVFIRIMKDDPFLNNKGKFITCSHNEQTEFKKDLKNKFHKWLSGKIKETRKIKAQKVKVQKIKAQKIKVHKTKDQDIEEQKMETQEIKAQETETQEIKGTFFSAFEIDFTLRGKTVPWYYSVKVKNDFEAIKKKDIKKFNPPNESESYYGFWSNSKTMDYIVSNQTHVEDIIDKHLLCLEDWMEFFGFKEDRFNFLLNVTVLAFGNETIGVSFLLIGNFDDDKEKKSLYFQEILWKPATVRSAKQI